jgi:hypothetical protein
MHMADRHKSTSGVSAQQGAAENQQQPTDQPCHTPGPWKCFRHPKYDHWQVTVPASNSCMRIALFETEGVPGDDESERSGNAYLIAAAPDLLAACEALIAYDKDAYVKLFGKQADLVKYIRKGDRLTVSGRLEIEPCSAGRVAASDAKRRSLPVTPGLLA